MVIKKRVRQLTPEGGVGCWGGHIPVLIPRLVLVAPLEVGLLGLLAVVKHAMEVEQTIPVSRGGGRYWLWQP